MRIPKKCGRKARAGSSEALGGLQIKELKKRCVESLTRRGNYQRFRLHKPNPCPPPIPPAAPHPDTP